MVTNELQLFSGLDQSLPTDNELIRQILDQVSERFYESLEQKNPYIALDKCKEFLDIGKLSGLALAKFFYLIESNWDKYEQEESFSDVAIVYLGKHKHTVERYIKVWKIFEEGYVPEEMKDALLQRNIKELIPIGNAIAQGIEFTEDDWEELDDAPDESSVRRVVRDVSGKPPRLGSLQLVMDTDGFIYAYANDERRFVGSLDVHDEDETVQKSINRIIKNSGIMQK